jgi:thiol-disulfide isomerase/thioredoxin
MLDRREFLAVVAAASLGLPAAAMAEGATPYDPAAFAAAQEKGGPILIAIHADWCGICRIQKVVVDDLVKSADLAALTVFRLDFDSQKDALASFGADTQSTLIVFKGKTEMGRAVGIMNNTEIEALLRKSI